MDNNTNNEQQKRGFFSRFSKKDGQNPQNHQDRNDKKERDNQRQNHQNKPHHSSQTPQNPPQKRQFPNSRFQGIQDSNRVPRGGAREVQGAKEKGNLEFHKDLKKGVETNTRIQKNSLNPHNKLDLSTKEKIKITPL